jgi:hypothetical protein
LVTQNSSFRCVAKGVVGPVTLIGVAFVAANEDERTLVLIDAGPLLVAVEALRIHRSDVIRTGRLAALPDFLDRLAAA